MAALAVLAVVASGASLLGACGGSSEQAGTGDAKLPSGMRSETIEHEACSESGHRVMNLDANGDGKPDVKRVFDGNREVCRITDLDRDGKPEMFEYYDASGAVRRREADYDDSGVVDAIEYYEGGKLVRRELDTSGEHRIDTWDFFDPQSGKRTRRERDASGSGRVDQWWTYDGDKVTIAFDKNGDGKPDPADMIDIGGTGGTTTPSAPPDAGPPPSTASELAGGDAGAAAASAEPSSTSAAPDAGAVAKPTPAKAQGGKKK